MVKIAVTGGKGGTGKSTLAVNLAFLLAEQRDLVLADLDVEAPNDHILLSVELKGKEEVRIMTPIFNLKTCIRCGVCAYACPDSAILLTKTKLPVLIPTMCSGCRACYFACPTRPKAVIEGYRVVGYTYETKVTFGNVGFVLVTGVLIEGEERTYPVTLATLRRAQRKVRDVLIVDTSAGTSNSVAASLENSDLILAVTEPTPLGIHDLEMILRLTREIGADRVWVIINRSTIAPNEPVIKIAEKYKAPIIAKIPYSKEIVESYVRGKPLVLINPASTVSKSIRDLARKVSEVI